MVGPISYIGGKNRLAKKIISLFPTHRTFVELFAGGGQVLFHMEPSPVEVLNDIDGMVTNFYKVLVWHHEELIRFLKYWPASRKLHEWMLQADDSVLTDVQRAAKFLYLQRNSFAGLILKQHFHVSVVQRPNFKPERLPEIIERAHERLRVVQIECRPYEQILATFDRPSTLFFADPPYWGPKLYRYNFTPDDFRLLADRLAQIRGKVLLTINDRPEVRQVFRHFHLIPVELAYSSQRGSGQRYKELIITNYEPP